MRMPTPIVPEHRHGSPGWLHVVTGRWFPLIAGAEEPTAEEKAAAEKAQTDAAAAKAAADTEAAKAAEEKGKQAPTQADLDKAYEKLRAAEAAAKEGTAAKKKLAELEAASLSETEKLKKEAEDGKAAASKAVETLRKANLRLALASTKGLADPKAAAGLITGVEYDDEGEPSNLDDRVKALLVEYPLLKGDPAKPKPPDLNGGGGGGDEKPDLTAEELDAAKATGTTPERYAALKKVTTLDDWERLQAASAKK